jgi:hypothetical protein
LLRNYRISPNQGALRIAITTAVSFRSLKDPIATAITVGGLAIGFAVTVTGAVVTILTRLANTVVVAIAARLTIRIIRVDKSVTIVVDTVVTGHLGVFRGVAAIGILAIDESVAIVVDTVVAGHLGVFRGVAAIGILAIDEAVAVVVDTVVALTLVGPLAVARGFARGRSGAVRFAVVRSGDLLLSLAKRVTAASRHPGRDTAEVVVGDAAIVQDSESVHVETTVENRPCPIAVTAAEPVLTILLSGTIVRTGKAVFAVASLAEPVTAEGT